MFRTFCKSTIQLWNLLIRRLEGFVCDYVKYYKFSRLQSITDAEGCARYVKTSAEIMNKLHYHMLCDNRLNVPEIANAVGI